MYASKFNVFCLTETWLSDFVFDNEILPHKFVVYRKDRPSRGGGVLIAVHDSIPSLLLSSPLDLEVVSVKLCNQDLILCTVYVPPCSSEFYMLSVIQYLSGIVCSYSNCIIVGDFNLPDVCWSSLSGTTSLSNHFCEFVFDHNLTQHVMDPTHNLGNTLDLVLTSAGMDVTDLSVTPSVQHLSSDHFMISFSPLCCKVPTHNYCKPRYVFDYANADFVGLCSYLMDVDFSLCFQSSDIEFMWFTIKSVIYDAMLLYIPKVRLKSRQSPKWFDSHIRHLLNCLRTLRRKYNAHPTPHLLLKINSLEERLQTQISSAKSAFESHLLMSLQSNDSTKFFSYIRSVSGQNAIPHSLHFNNISVDSDQDKATLFNRHFHSVFTNSSFSLPNICDLPKPNSVLKDTLISEDEVLEALMSLDPSKAMGCDGIGPKLLKHCALALYQPFYHLFCESLAQHYIPFEWHMHLIKPIFKSGDRSSVTNYRPISLLCVSSKVLERIVYNHIIEFVISNISVHQFGFLRGHSTLQQLLIFTNIVNDSFNSNSQTDVLYLDFKKAFDSVAHNELLFKLWSFGVTGNLWKWFQAYLTNRVQCVSVNNAVSDALPVVSGVPQGSILGPILFLVFVNDIPATLTSSLILLFADDAKCVQSVSQMSDYLSFQEGLNKFVTWSTTIIKL